MPSYSIYRNNATGETVRVTETGYIQAENWDKQMPTEIQAEHWLLAEGFIWIGSESH